MTIKTLDLDQVVFFIYPEMSVLKEKFPSLSSSKELLTGALVEIRKLFNTIQREYFWHDEGIHWEILDRSTLPFICGKIRFGDGMEDEWFALKLLLSLTSNDTSLVASIFDTDGDFVLIEAAQVLPEWLEPETSKNRVFIHKGSVQIIPLKPNEEGSLQLHEALKYIREGKTDSQLNQTIMKEIETKLLEEQKLHKAKVLIPLDIMKILSSKRQSIGPAISSFYNREPGNLKLCQFKNRPTQITTVSMTRIQFAQLACQELKGICDDFDLMKYDQPIAAELGLKLTLGFEILLSKDGEDKFIEKFDESSKSVQDEIRTILSSDDGNNNNFDSWINNEPEDSLEWMEIDENTFESDLNAKFEQNSMNEMEQSDLIETWTREFEGEKGQKGVNKLKEGISEIDEIVEKLKNMIESKSNFEGIENHEDCDSANETSGDSDTELYDNSDSEYDHNESQFDSENDENLLEREIFETINFDPDLLMKIVEANTNAGVSSEDFLNRFRKYQEENPQTFSGSSLKQKGLADIEESKLKEARFKRVSVEEKEIDTDNDNETDNYTDNDNDNDNENELSDCSVSDEFIYGETFKQFKQSNANSIDPNTPTMKEYYSAMDNELSNSLLTTSDSKLPSSYHEDSEIETNLGKNLIESMGAGGFTRSGPIETVITSLKK